VATHDWQLVADELEKLEHQDNTHLLVEKLSKPLDEVYPMSQTWVRDIIEKCRQNPNECSFV
jgi:hypothetical protein